MILIEEDFSRLFKNMTEMDFESLMQAAAEFSSKNNYGNVIERVFHNEDLAWGLGRAEEKIEELEADLEEKNNEINDLVLTISKISEIADCDSFKEMEDALNEIKKLSS